MDQILEFIQSHKIEIGSVLAVLFLGWEKIKSFLASVKDKLPSFKGLLPKVSTASTEDQDQSALRHLRNRALESNDPELLDLIRKIDSRFYDIHLGLKK